MHTNIIIVGVPLSVILEFNLMKKLNPTTSLLVECLTSPFATTIIFDSDNNRVKRKDPKAEDDYNERSVRVVC
jgi:hypothetical protein